jgi:hypothetical protein
LDVLHEEVASHINVLLVRARGRCSRLTLPSLSCTALVLTSEAGWQCQSRFRKGYKGLCRAKSQKRIRLVPA